MARKYGLYINGNYVHSENWLPVPLSLNPQELLAEASQYTESDDPSLFEACLEGSHQTHAQVMEGFFPHAERLLFLEKLHARMTQQQENMARLIMQEVGKPITLARMEVARGLQTIEATRAAAEELLKAPHPVNGTPSGPSAQWEHFPRGPLLAITPYNFPLNLTLHKILPALISGNPVVLKPSPKSTMTALCIADYCHAEGLPPGMLNVFQCENKTVGKLIDDTRIQQISFTGSSKVGWALKAQTTKPFTLELGGAAPSYVAEDADLEKAAQALAPSAMAYSGQVCISAQTVLVAPSVYGEFKEHLISAVSKLVSGSPAIEDVFVGPVVDAEAKQRIEGLKQQLEGEGATVTSIFESFSSKENINPILFSKNGWQERYVAPMLIEDLPETSSFWREEAFAPMVGLRKCDSWENFLDFANGLEHRLQCSIWSQDGEKLKIASSRLRYGGVMCNAAPSTRIDSMPYGGCGLAGQGREGPKFAIEEFCEKRVQVVESNA